MVDFKEKAKARLARFKRTKLGTRLKPRSHFKLRSDPPHALQDRNNFVPAYPGQTWRRHMIDYFANDLQMIRFAGRKVWDLPDSMTSE